MGIVSCGVFCAGGQKDLQKAQLCCLAPVCFGNHSWRALMVHIRRVARVTISWGVQSQLLCCGAAVHLVLGLLKGKQCFWELKRDKLKQKGRQNHALAVLAVSFCLGVWL